MLRVGVVVLMVVLAGCTGGGVSGGDAPTPGADADSGGAAGEKRDRSENVAAADNPVAENPWQKERVTVALNVSAAVRNETRHRIALRDAVQWVNSNNVSDYPVTLRIGPETQADVVVEAGPRIENCGAAATNTSVAFCGPRLTADTTAAATERIQVSSRYMQDQTRVYYHAAPAQLVGARNVTQYDRIQFDNQTRLYDPFPDHSPVPVSIENSPEDINATRQVQDAIAYWGQGNGARYRDHDARFVVRPNATDAPVTVRYSDNRSVCGTNVTSAQYTDCAPRIDGDSTAPDHVEIGVSTLYANEAMEQSIAHQFGHVYGLAHGDWPTPLMRGDTRLLMSDQPNVTEREQPWRNDTLFVYSDRDSVTRFDKQEYDEEMAGAFDYVQGGADIRIPTEVQFVSTDNRSKADIVIEQVRLPEGNASSVNASGIDLDDDGAFEYFTRLRIYLNEAEPTENYAYHTAYWIVRTFVGEDDIMPRPIDRTNDDKAEWERHD